MKHKIKRLTALLCAALAAIGCFMGCTPEQKADQREYQLIYDNEIRPQMLLLSNDPAGDWENEPYEGTTLGQHARQQTLLALERYQKEQAIFAQYGVCDFSYESFLEQWQSQGSDGNPYGVQSYSQYDYYVYLHSIYRLQVIEQLEAPEADVRAYFESNRELFLDAEVWHLELWQAQDASEALLRAAMDGESREDITYTQLRVDADSAKYQQSLLLLLDDAMEQLKTPGQTVYKKDQGTCVLVRSTGYTPPQYKEYEACKDVAAKRYKQAQYEKLLTEKGG